MGGPSRRHEVGEASWQAATVVTLLLVLQVLALGVTGSSQADSQPVEMIVGFDPVPGGIERGDRYHQARVLETNHQVGFIVVETDEPDRFAEDARSDHRTIYVEENDRIEVLEVTPNDPRWSDQYGPQQVNAPAAWEDSFGETGRNVCVIDTGVRRSHEDLEASRYIGGYDFVDGDTDPNDSDGHGTHVTGIAAATTNNGAGIAGMAQVGYLHVRLLDGSSSTSISTIANSIEWCADNGGDVISMSIGWDGDYSAIRQAITYAWDQGSLLISSAGNEQQDGSCTDCITYPAKYGKVMAVTCTDDSKGFCWFSSRGPEAELAAPGEDILSLSRSSDSSYTRMSGTSMSAPHVAGAATLLWSVAPYLSNQEVRDALTISAEDLGPSGKDERFGYGLLDIDAAFSKLQPSQPRDLVVDRGPAEDEHSLSWDPPSIDGGQPVDTYRIYTRVQDPEGTLRNDDGTREDRLDLDYTDDTAIKRLEIPSDLLDEATEAHLWIYAEAYACADAPEGEAHTVYANLLAVDSYDPCQLFPTSGQGWASIQIPLSLLTSGTNRFEVSETSGDWTDRNLMMAIDTDASGEEDTAEQNGNDIQGALMWALVLGSGQPGEVILLDETPDLTYLRSGLTIGQTYHYTVSAVNSNGEGPKAPWVTQIAEFEPPGPPQDPAADPGPGLEEITVSWSYPEDDGGPSVDAYRIYRGTSSGELSFHQETTNASSFVDRGGLDPETSYHYQVTAVTSEGEGEPSLEVAATIPQVPDSPQDPAAWTGSQPGQIDLGWQAPVDDGGADLTAYRVYRGPAGEEPSTLVAEVSSTTTQHTDTGLADDTAYAYHVTAVNEVGEGAPSVQVEATTAGVPEAPAGLDADTGFEPGHIIVTWSAPSSDGRSELTAYRVYRGLPGDPVTLIAEVGPTTTAFTDTGLEDDTTYAYEVAAVNDVGQGPAAGPVEASTADVPDAPAELTPDRGPDPGEITVTWSAPADDGGLPVIKYQVLAGDDPSTTSVIAEVGPGTLAYTETGLADGQVRYYEVVAVNDVGPGPAAGPVEARAPDLPGTPEGVAADPGPELDEITISWSPPTDTGGLAIEAYLVHRTIDGGSASLIAEVPGDTTTFTDDGLDDSVYGYTVTAVNAVGPGSSTEEVTATTPETPGEPRNPKTLTGPGAGEITVSWRPPTDDGGNEITGYRVYTVEDDEPHLLATTGPETQHTHEELDDGQSVTYQIRAVNDAGPGLWSQPVTGSAPTLPGAPSSIFVRSTGTGTLLVAWSAPMDTGGIELTDYIVHRSDGLGGWTHVATVPSDRTSYEDDAVELLLPIPRSYQVTAVNEVGPGPPVTSSCRLASPYTFAEVAVGPVCGL